MLVLGLNDDEESLLRFSRLLEGIRYDRLYINTPVRPPAEKEAKAVSSEMMKHAVEILNGASIDLLVSSGLHSEISDNYEAILSIKSILLQPLDFRTFGLKVCKPLQQYNVPVCKCQ